MWKSLHWLFWLVNSPLFLTTSWELEASTKEIRGPHLHNGQVHLQMLMSVCVYQCACVWEWAFYSHHSSHCVGSRWHPGFHGKDFGMDPGFSCRLLRAICLAVTPWLEGLHPCSPEAQSWGWGLVHPGDGWLLGLWTSWNVLSTYISCPTAWIYNVGLWRVHRGVLYVYIEQLHIR